MEEMEIEASRCHHIRRSYNHCRYRVSGAEDTCRKSLLHRDGSLPWPVPCC